MGHPDKTGQTRRVMTAPGGEPEPEDKEPFQSTRQSQVGTI